MLISQFYDSALTKTWDSSHRLFSDLEFEQYFNSSSPRREKQIWIRNNHSDSVFVRVRPGSKDDGEILSDELDSWLQFGLTQIDVDEDEITFSLAAGQVRSYFVAVDIPDDFLNVVELGDRFPVYSQFIDVAVRTSGTDTDGQILLNSQYDFDNGGNYRGIFYSEDGLRTVDGVHGDYWQDFDFSGSTPFRISDAEALGDGHTVLSVQLTFRRASTRDGLDSAPIISVPELTPSSLGFVRLNLRIVGARDAVSVESVRFVFEGSIATSYLFGTYLAYQARSDFPEGVVIVDRNEVVKYVVSKELISFNFGYKRDGGNGAFSLGLRLDWDAVLPFQYDDFVLYVKDGVVAYRGIIDSIRNRYNVKERIDVSGSGLASQLNSIMVTDKFLSIGIKTILLTLLDKYLSDSYRPEIRYRLVDIEDIEDSATFTFRNESLYSVIQKLASFSGANPTNRGGDGTDIIWGVNENGLFYFRRKSTEFKYPFHIGRNVSFDNSRIAPEFNSLVLIGDTGGNDFQNYLLDGDCELTQGSSNPDFFQIWDVGENVPVVATRDIDDVQHGSQAYKVEVDHVDSFDLSKAFQNKPAPVISGGRYQLSYHAKANQSFTVDLGVTLVFGIVDPETGEFSALNVDVSEGVSGSSAFLGGDLASWRWEETIGNLGSGEVNLQTTVLSVRYIDFGATDRELAIRATNLVGQSLTIENQTTDGSTVTGRVTSVRYNPISVSITLSDVVHTGATDDGDLVKIRLASASQIFFSLGQGYAKYFIPAFTAPVESPGVPYENLGLVVIFHPKTNGQSNYFILDSIFLYRDRDDLPKGRYLRQDGHLYEYEYFGSDVEYEVRVTDLTLQGEFGRRKEMVETIDSISGFTEAFRYAKAVLGTKGNENRRLRLTAEDSEEFFLPYSIENPSSGVPGEINWGYAQIFGSDTADSFYEYVIVSVSHTLKNNRLSSNLELGSPFPSPSKIVRDLTARDRFRGELGSREGATSRNPLAGGGGGGQAAAVAYMLPTGQELYDLITPFLDYDHLQNKPDSFFVEYSEDKVFWIDTDIVTEFRKIFEETDFFLNIVDSNEIYVGLILSNGVLFGYSPEMDSFYTTISSGTIRIEQGSSFFQGDIISNHTWRANVRRFQCENITRSGAFLDDTLVNIRFSFKANFVRWSIDRINWLEFDLRIDISEIESQVQTDWEEMDADSLAFLLNKPEIEPQVQTDWEETDTDLPAFLLNKPDISDVSDFLNQAEILALLPDVSDFLNQAEILALLPDVSDFLNQAEILALLPDVSDFLTDIEVLGLSSTIVSRGNVYRRMKQIVRFEPEVLIDDDDSAESITWSTGAYML